MSRFSGFDTHPKKTWQCDCCFEFYSCKVIDLNGGVCPSCGYGYFTVVEDTVPIWVPDKAPSKRPVPDVKREELLAGCFGCPYVGAKCRSCDLSDIWANRGGE